MVSKAVNETKEKLLSMTVREYFGQLTANKKIHLMQKKAHEEAQKG